mgnify:CR=1 FL=1
MKGKQKFGSSSSSNVSALRRAAMERRFREKLHNLGLEMHETEPDGNCLFRSFAHQMYGDQSFHNLVREACMNYMVSIAFILHSRSSLVLSSCPNTYNVCIPSAGKGARLLLPVHQ